MSISRRQRRKLERDLGLMKKAKIGSPIANEISRRKRAAGKEIHRQNIERLYNNPLFESKEDKENNQMDNNEDIINVDTNIKKDSTKNNDKINE